MRIVTISLVLALTACDGGREPANEAVPPAAAASPPAGATRPPAEATPPPAQAAEKVLKSETVGAVFTGWEIGDYVWANLKVKGREAAGAWVGPSPLEHFLEAHKGRPITVRIDTIRTAVPEAGGEEDVQKIAQASANGVTAAAWWAGLSEEERKAAEQRMEAVLGGGV